MYGMSMRRKQIVILAVVVEAGLGVVALAGGWWWKLPVGEWVAWSAEGLGWGLAQGEGIGNGRLFAGNTTSVDNASNRANKTRPKI